MLKYTITNISSCESDIQAGHQPRQHASTGLRWVIQRGTTEA